MNRHTGQRSRIWRLDSLTGLAFAVFCGLGLAAAETYPDRPIKLVVPFGAGGPPDVAARIVAGYLSTHLGALFIENRPGAGGTIAAKAVAAMPPDGYSLMLATSGALSISPQLYHDAGYDPVKSFAPISLISTAPLVLAINAQMPIHNISELVAYASRTQASSTSVHRSGLRRIFRERCSRSLPEPTSFLFPTRQRLRQRVTLLPDRSR